MGPINKVTEAMDFVILIGHRPTCNLAFISGNQRVTAYLFQRLSANSLPGSYFQLQYLFEMPLLLLMIALVTMTMFNTIKTLVRLRHILRHNDDCVDCDQFVDSVVTRAALVGVLPNHKDQIMMNLLINS